MQGLRAKKRCPIEDQLMI